MTTTLAAFAAQLAAVPDDIDAAGPLCDWLEEQGAAIGPDGGDWDVLRLYAEDALPRVALACWCRKTEPEKCRDYGPGGHKDLYYRWQLVSLHQPNPDAALGYPRPSGMSQQCFDYAVALELKRRVLRLFPEVRYGRQVFVPEHVLLKARDDYHCAQEFRNLVSAAGINVHRPMQRRRDRDNRRFVVYQWLTALEALLPAETSDISPLVDAYLWMVDEIARGLGVPADVFRGDTHGTNYDSTVSPPGTLPRARTGQLRHSIPRR
jgi:hypothetical protein